MQTSRNLVDGYSAAKALMTDATGCKMDFPDLMLLLNVQYTSEHFLLVLHIVGMEEVQDWEILWYADDITYN
jgi:hypothetical protein